MTNFILGLAVGIAGSWFVIKELAPWLEKRRKNKHNRHILITNYHGSNKEDEIERYAAIKIKDGKAMKVSMKVMEELTNRK